jgi:hypothetical protein
MILKTIGFASLLALTVMTSTCDAKTEPCNHSPGFEHYRKEPKFALPFKASETRERDLADRFKHLSLGMSEQEVFDLMGEPDQAQEAWAKERPRCIGVSWTYYIQVDRDFSNANNKLIEIFFNKAGKTKWVVSSTVSGLKELGSPSQAR